MQARTAHRKNAIAQRGATLAEFLVVAPVLLAIGGGTLQTGLLYHGKTTLNYAAFEAARAGAVHHARIGPMREELGTRLAPLQGGTGERASALAAIAKSRRAVDDPVTGRFTRIEIRNPTVEAFDGWAVTSVETGRRVIPNSHLRLRDADGGTEIRAGVSLKDANLLRIEVTHGVELKVPFVGWLVGEAMERLDPGHADYYRAGLFPLTSVATVRMQSEAWADDIVAAAAAPSGGASSESFGDASDSRVADGGTHGGPMGGGAGSGAGGDGLGGEGGIAGGGELCGDGLPPADTALPLVSANSCEAATPFTGGAGDGLPSSGPVSLGGGC